MLRAGEQKIAAVYCGGAKIKRAYVGDTLTFEANKPSRLPEGYQEVRYIQSPGSVFLNTVVMGAAMKMVMDLEPTEVPSSGIYHYFLFAYSRHSVGNGRYQHRQLAVNYAPTFIGGVMGSGSGTSTTPSWNFSKITENVAPRRMLITIEIGRAHV